jgi:hypothetical protein
VESSKGDRSSWEVIWRAQSKSANALIVQSLGERVTERLKTQAGPASGPASQRTWKFTDPRGRRWVVRLDAADSGEPGVKHVMMTAILAS